MNSGAVPELLTEGRGLPLRPRHELDSDLTEVSVESDLGVVLLEVLGEEFFVSGKLRLEQLLLFFR